MTHDPRAAIAAAPMHRLQIVVVALCIALNALDGFDVLAISFAAPGIAAEWGVDKATLGVVLSMELLGMAAGSVLMGIRAARARPCCTTRGRLEAELAGLATVAPVEGGSGGTSQRHSARPWHGVCW